MPRCITLLAFCVYDSPGQGDVVQVPLLKLKHTCCAVGVHNKEEVEEPDPEPDLEDLANDANMRRRGIR